MSTESKRARDRTEISRRRVRVWERYSGDAICGSVKMRGNLLSMLKAS